MGDSGRFSPAIPFLFQSVSPNYPSIDRNEQVVDVHCEIGVKARIEIDEQIDCGHDDTRNP